MKPTKVLLSLTFTLLLLIAPQVSLALELPAIFASNMVLQREQPNTIWGKAKPGNKVTVTFIDQSFSAKANRDGKWTVKIPGHPANAKPQSMTITGDEQTITFENILIGEVWVCSGQSNMEWNVRNSVNGEKEVEAATDGLIRLCKVSKKVADTPQDDAVITWDVCSPQKVASFSAVGYFFGRHLRSELNVPVGLIHTNWGGTPAEAWTSIEALKANPVTQEILTRWDSILKQYPQALKDWEVAYKQWQDADKSKIKPRHDDPGNLGYAKGYAKPDFDDHASVLIAMTRSFI